MGIVAQLLEHTGLRLAEIAARVGYRSEFAFSRGFARARGLSPARFRNRGNSTRRPNLLCVSKTSSVLIAWQNHITSARMVALISFLLNVVASLFKSKSRLEAENAALRHQLIVLQRKVRGRVPFTNSDRLFFVAAVSLVSVGPQGRDDHPARDGCALASCRLSPLLAPEIALPGRPAANRSGSADADPTDEH